MAAERAQVLRAGLERRRAGRSRGCCGPSRAPRPRRRARSTTTGRWWRSTSREATIPTTPGCQPSPASDQRRRLAQLLRQLAPRRLGGGVDLPLGRPPLARWPGSAPPRSPRPAPSSSVSNSSTPASARYSRPAALIRGASRNARSPSSSRVGSHFDASISARSPRPLRPPHLLQPPLHQRPVLADQRHHVGDRRQRDEIEIAGRRGRSRTSACRGPPAAAAAQPASRPPPSRTAPRTDSRRAPGAGSGSPAAPRRADGGR